MSCRSLPLAADRCCHLLLLLAVCCCCSLLTVGAGQKSGDKGETGEGARKLATGKMGGCTGGKLLVLRVPGVYLYAGRGPDDRRATTYSHGAVATRQDTAHLEVGPPTPAPKDAALCGRRMLRYDLWRGGVAAKRGNAAGSKWGEQ